MINYVRRNFKQVNNHLDKKKLTDKQKEILENINILLRQQIEIYKNTPRNGKKHGIRIKDRIVSIFKGHVRPIPRGKTPQRTEFGNKVLLEMRNGYVIPLHITNENTADSTLAAEYFKKWKGKSLGGDRGFHSKQNTKNAKKVGISHYFIEKKGKVGLKKTRAVKKIRSLRSTLEAKIGLAKRKFGSDRNRYNRGMEGDHQWIILSFLGMNIKRLISNSNLNELCLH
jgi:hypothetical protein